MASDSVVWRQFYARDILGLPSSNQISRLRGGCYLPSQESAICPFVGLSAIGIRWIIRSSPRTGSNSSSRQDELHKERRILMGYHSEPKTPEEIREIFREVQAAKVARAESSHEKSRLDRELHITISPNIPFKSWTGRYFDEAQAA